MDQPYQVLPPFSPEDYAALKADIEARGVLVAVEYDEDDHILDGVHRVQICQELGITEWPRVVRTGLSEEEKRAHAWRLNLARRHLSRSQKRAIAVTLRQEGWTQENIAQMLSIKQPTISRWLWEFIQMHKLPQSDTIQGKDGKHYPSTKAGRRSKPQSEGGGARASVDAHPTPSHMPEAADPEASLSQHADTKEESVALSPHPEAQYIAGEMPVAQQATASTGDAPAGHGGMLAEATKRPERLQEPSEETVQVGLTNLLAAFAELLHGIDAQGGMPSLSARWSPQTKAQYLTEIRQVKAVLATWEDVLIGEMGEVAVVHSAADGQVTTLHVPPPVADEALGDMSADLVTTSRPIPELSPDLKEIIL
jgi:Homeodomain-like domain/ParB-like nuclease domain